MLPMSDTRRTFINSVGAVAAGLSGAAALSAQASPQIGGAQQPNAPNAPNPLQPASEIQVPKMKFGNVEVSRLVCGCNPLYGFAHFNQALAACMREYYTQEKVCEILHQCNRFGINTLNYYPGAARGVADYERFTAEGGKMHIISQGTLTTAESVAANGPKTVDRWDGALSGPARVADFPRVRAR